MPPHAHSPVPVRRRDHHRTDQLVIAGRPFLPRIPDLSPGTVVYDDANRLPGRIAIGDITQDAITLTRHTGMRWTTNPAAIRVALDSQRAELRRLEERHREERRRHSGPTRTLGVLLGGDDFAHTIAQRLARAGITTFAQLSAMPPNGYLHVWGLGPTSIYRINEAVEHHTSQNHAEGNTPR